MVLQGGLSPCPSIFKTANQISTFLSDFVSHVSIQQFFQNWLKMRIFPQTTIALPVALRVCWWENGTICKEESKDINQKNINWPTTDQETCSGVQPVLKPFSFRTGVLKQNSFCCFSDSSILLWYHFFAKHFWSFFLFFLNAKMTEYCLNYYISCIPVPICLFPFPWSCCKHAFSAVTGMM